MKPDYAIVCEQNRRSYMEDFYYFDANFVGKGWIFAGIYDGHSGSGAAKYAATNLHQRFLQALAKNGIKDAFAIAYQLIDQEINRQFSHSGTCAVNFFIKDKEIFYANAGDSRIIIIGEKVSQLTTDHRVNLASEKQRIIQAGGEITGRYVYWQDAGLMVTRALGDDHFKKAGVIAMPSVGYWSVKPTDKFLIAACDGLFDHLSNNQVAEIAKQDKSAQEVANTLFKQILSIPKANDNITIIVVKLD